MSTSNLPRRCETALFIDFDGTLVDIAHTPNAVDLPKGAGVLLADVKRALGGATAIITGRPIVEIDRLVGVVDIPIAGVHGAQVRMSAAGPLLDLAEAIEPDAIKALHRAAAPFDRVWVEEKGPAVAVHYRAAAPEAIGPLEGKLAEALSGYRDRLIVNRGRKVFEIVPLSMSKGRALAAFMREAPFLGRRPIMIGDDHSDESAMEAARQLGGEGMRVAGEHFPREDAEFHSPAAVRAWLNALANANEGRTHEIAAGEGA